MPDYADTLAKVEKIEGWFVQNKDTQWLTSTVRSLVAALQAAEEREQALREENERKTNALEGVCVILGGHDQKCKCQACKAFDVARRALGQEVPKDE